MEIHDAWIQEEEGFESFYYREDWVVLKAFRAKMTKRKVFYGKRFESSKNLSRIQIWMFQIGTSNWKLAKRPERPSAFDLKALRPSSLKSPHWKVRWMLAENSKIRNPIYDWYRLIRNSSEFQSFNFLNLWFIGWREILAAANTLNTDSGRCCCE